MRAAMGAIQRLGKDHYSIDPVHKESMLWIIDQIKKGRTSFGDDSDNAVR